MSETIVKINIANLNSQCRMYIMWEESFFEITVLVKENCWYSLVRTNSLGRIAIKLGQDSTSYSNNLKKFLFYPDEHENIEFHIADKEFIVYKKIEDLRVKYFFTELEKAEYHICAEGIIDELLSKNTYLEKQQLLLQEMLNKEIEDKKSLSEQCNDLVENMENQKRKLLSSFTLLLNEKKKRIQFLTEVIDCRQRNSHSESKLNNAEHKTISSPTDSEEDIETENQDRQLETISDSETEQSNESDIENAYEIINKKRQHSDANFKADEPSTSKDDIASFLEETSAPITLPKRLKCNNLENPSSITFTEVCATQHSDNNEQKFEEHKSIEKDEEEPVYITTQDILDRM